VRFASSLRVFFACDLKLKEFIEEPFRHEVWLGGAQV
jgi:hypothetical protein